MDQPERVTVSGSLPALRPVFSRTLGLCISISLFSAQLRQFQRRFQFFFLHFTLTVPMCQVSAIQSVPLCKRCVFPDHTGSSQFCRLRTVVSDLHMHTAVTSVAAVPSSPSVTSLSSTQDAFAAEHNAHCFAFTPGRANTPVLLSLHPVSPAPGVCFATTPLAPASAPCFSADPDLRRCRWQSGPWRVCPTWFPW
jgi:hypothetical protein